MDNEIKRQNTMVDPGFLLKDNLQGDVKRLTNYTSEYRMRVGDWRILFEIEDEKIVVYRIRHRKEAYK